MGTCIVQKYSLGRKIPSSRLRLLLKTRQSMFMKTIFEFSAAIDVSNNAVADDELDNISTLKNSGKIAEYAMKLSDK